MNISKWNLLFVWLLLLLFGILAVYSVSIHESFSLTLSQWEPSNYFYFWRQLRNIWIAIVLWILVYKTPLERFKKYYKRIFLWTIIFQLLVLIPWLGIELNWSRSWIYLPWLGTLQPSEFFKIWFGIFLAWWLNEKKNVLNTQNWIIWYIIVIWLSVLLFLIIKDNGTILVLGILSLISYRYAWWSAKVIWLFIWLWSILWLIIYSQFGYVQERVNFFLNPSTDKNKDKWRQTIQWLISVWWWWIFWRWYWKWIQKFTVPEAQSDFIFATFSEEIWFVGNIFLIFLFWCIIYIYLSSAWNIKDNYYRILWWAMLSTIIVQTFINIWVNTNIIPLTWLTLPFISFWWSGIMANTAQLMILHKIKKTYSPNN